MDTKMDCFATGRWWVLFMCLEVQVNQWKCSREAKRQGYLEGNFIPHYRFSPAACICEKQIKPDGTIDNSARKVIDLENKKLFW
jgi:hypothetical protein